MKKALIILFLFGPSSCLLGQTQSFYASTDNQGLIKLDAGSCDTVFIGRTSETLTDIALTPDKRLYGLNFTTLFEIDTSNATLHTIIDTLSIFGGNSLVSDTEGNLLTVVNDSVYQINRFTGQVISLGYLGYYSAGDLTFFNNYLYLSEVFGKLVRITLHPFISAQVVGTMTTAISTIYGINTVCLNGKETMIVSLGDNYQSSLYSVSSENAMLTLLCDTIIHSSILGMASPSNFIESKGCFITNNTNYPIIYPNPVIDILNVSYNNAEPLIITIFDVTSKKIMKKEFANSFSLNIENFAAGVYMFQIENDEGIIQQGKIIKQ